MKVTYKEVKENQKKHFAVYYTVYRKISSPFTYLFVRLGMSPGAVSILNFFTSIIGLVFLSMGTYVSMAIGLLLFILYKILDCSDGEVARIVNPKAMDPKHKKIEGSYFDAVGHFIEPICLGAGLGIGLYHMYNGEIYILLGVILAILLTLEYALNELVRSYFRKGIIERGIKLKDSLKGTHERLMENIAGKSVWSKQNKFLKIFGVYPPGLLYSREFIPIIFLLLVFVEYLTGSYIRIKFVFYWQIVGILPIYFFIIIGVKLIKTIIFISKIKKNEPITGFLNQL